MGPTTGVAFALCCLTARNATAAVIASDSAANYTAANYPSAPPNLGTGFGNWSVTNNGSATTFVGSTALGSQTFGVAANGTGSSNLSSFVRRFSPASSALSVGESFSATLAATAVTGSTAYAGIAFYASGSGTNVLDLSVTNGGGFWQYSVDGDTTELNTTIPFNANAQLQVTLERTGLTTVQLTLQQQGSSTWSQQLTPDGSRADVFEASFYAIGTGGSSNTVNLGFNNLQIQSVPEPSTFAMLFAGGLTVSGAAIRRRRRRRRG